MYIYKTTNLINGKFYIGKRVYRKRDDNWYLGSGIYLNRAIQKYGRTNFKKEIIEWCDNKEDLCKREIFWIKELDANNPLIGYNISKGGEGGNTGNYEVISRKLKGVKKSKEFCENISKRLKGVPKSQEHIEKVRYALSGIPRSPEMIEKMRNSLKEKYKNGYKSPVQVRVYQYNKVTGDYIKSYKSATEASRQLNINRKAITNNCVGKSKSSGGFIWSKIKQNNIL